MCLTGGLEDWEEVSFERIGEPVETLTCEAGMGGGCI